MPIKARKVEGLDEKSREKIARAQRSVAQGLSHSADEPHDGRLCRDIGSAPSSGGSGLGELLMLLESV